MLEADSNIADLEGKLDAMASASADLTDAWTEVGQWWSARQRTVFATRNKGAWPMRDPDTSKVGRGVLIRTGTLLRAVSNAKPITTSPTTATFGQRGSAGWYGVFHQRGKGGMPLRQPVPPITDAEGDEITRIIAAQILEAK